MKISTTRITITAFVALTLFAGAGMAWGNTIASSTMSFEGELSSEPGGYSGTLSMVSSFDIYGRNGASAWFGEMAPPPGGDMWNEVAIANHDAWPSTSPDQSHFSYQLILNGTSWSLCKSDGGVPMSGTVNWLEGLAEETGTGAYLPGTGTALIAGGAAAHGGGAGCWDMDWTTGSEVVPLDSAFFTIEIFEQPMCPPLVVMTPTTAPVPEPSMLLLLGAGGLMLVAWMRRRHTQA